MRMVSALRETKQAAGSNLSSSRPPVLETACSRDHSGDLPPPAPGPRQQKSSGEDSENRRRLGHRGVRHIIHVEYLIRTEITIIDLNSNSVDESTITRSQENRFVTRRDGDAHAHQVSFVEEEELQIPAINLIPSTGEPGPFEDRVDEKLERGLSDLIISDVNPGRRRGRGKGNSRIARISPAHRPS